MKIAIITDSASNLQPEFIKKHNNLFVIPLLIVCNGVNYRDQIEMTAEEVYNQIDSHKLSTSLPDTNDLLKVVEGIKKEGYTHILCINVSSGLSGTFNAFRLVFEHVEGIDITHYDSLTIGAGLGYIVEYALELVSRNESPKDILPKLNHLRFEDSLSLYTIGTLKYLRRGGRIGRVEGTLGDLLHVKPVIGMNDEGVYVTVAKAFGIKRSLLLMKEHIVNKFKKDLVDLTIHYGKGKEKALVLASRIKKELNIRTLTLSPLTPVLGIHAGPEMFSYVARRIK